MTIGFCFFKEPVGLKRPTFSTDDKSSLFFRSRGDPVVLQCPAQGYPLPQYR